MAEVTPEYRARVETMALLEGMLRLAAELGAVGVLNANALTRLHRALVRQFDRPEFASDLAAQGWVQLVTDRLAELRAGPRDG